MAFCTVLHATINVRSPFAFETPNAIGICWTAMTPAIPTVKPSSTGHGTRLIILPKPANAITTTITPAINPKKGIALTP